jgi:mRNA-degrading endonuclease toxin of MazEF toxin-antitoxin module
MPNQGDILLVPIPFTDLSSQNRRPVIVISNNAYNKSKLPTHVAQDGMVAAAIQHGGGIVDMDE